MKASNYLVAAPGHAVPDEDLDALGNILAQTLLGPTAIRLIEAQADELQNNDIATGRVGVRHIHLLGTTVRLAVAIPGKPGLADISVVLFEQVDIDLIAGLVEILDRWDRRSGGHDG